MKTKETTFKLTFQYRWSPCLFISAVCSVDPCTGMSHARVLY